MSNPCVFVFTMFEPTLTSSAGFLPSKPPCIGTINFLCATEPVDKLSVTTSLTAGSVIPTVPFCANKSKSAWFVVNALSGKGANSLTFAQDGFNFEYQIGQTIAGVSDTITVAAKGASNGDDICGTIKWVDLT